MNGCEQIEEELDRYIDDELCAEDRRNLEAHLADCPECSLALQERREAMSMLADWNGALTAPRTRPVRRPGLWTALAAAAALLAAGIPVGVHFWTRPATIGETSHGKLVIRDMESGVTVLPGESGGPTMLMIDPFPEEDE